MLVVRSAVVGIASQLNTLTLSLCVCEILILLSRESNTVLSVCVGEEVLGLICLTCTSVLTNFDLYQHTISVYMFIVHTNIHAYVHT